MNEALVAEVSHARFTPVRGRPGYDMGEVDQFLDRLCQRLRAGEPVADFVTGARFTPVRFREGYDMGDVDDLLDRVVASAEASAPEGFTNPVAEVQSPLRRLFRRRR